MSNSLFNQLSKQPQNQPMNPMQMIQQLKSDPVVMLRQRGFDIPDGMNNPNQIIQHLMSSGQITQGRLNQVQQMARGFRR